MITQADLLVLSEVLHFPLTRLKAWYFSGILARGHHVSDWGFSCSRSFKILVCQSSRNAHLCFSLEFGAK